MELCKKVQPELYFIDVVDSTNSGYAHLRYSLLASPWFLRPLGLALWSVLHVLLVGSITLLLLAFFSVVFAVALSFDAFKLSLLLCMLLLEPVSFLLSYLIEGIVIALFWMFFLLCCCKCCTIPERSPGEGLVHYILSGGGLLTPLLTRQEVPVMGARNARAAAKEFPRKALAVRLGKFLTVDSFLFWRVLLGKFCREIVPLYDTVVI